METIRYRKDAGVPLTLEPNGQSQAVWHPGMFYPAASDAELSIWTHWLPTSLVFPRVDSKVPCKLDDALEQLHAPCDVLEECRWSCALELFDSYEIRTPQRRDLRDPLLLGRCGSQRYRVALWGESLRPFEDITALVQESLGHRKRAARWRELIMSGGMLLGLALGLWLGSQPSYEGSQIGAGLMFAFLGLLFTGVLTQAYAPETRQQRFLDRYR
jgi:hypothetical protein